MADDDTNLSDPSTYDLVPVDHTPQFSDAPVPKAGQTIQQPNVMGDISSMPGKVAQTVGDVTGISDAYKAATGQMTPEEAQMFALGALPMLAGGPEAKAVGEVASDIAPEVAKGIRAYHASPYDFNQFDISKVGTGQGAQAYGHGLYAAENPAVSGPGGQYDYEFTAKNLGKTDLNQQESMILNSLRAGKSDLDIIGELGRDHADALASMQRMAANARDAAQNTVDPVAKANNIEASKKADAYLKQLVSQDAFAQAQSALDRVKAARAKIYEVNINADPEHFLDWDKPLSEQPHIDTAKIGYPGGNITGQDYYRQLGIDNLMSGKIPPNDRAAQYQSAAERLRDAGIPGIKYLDQGSRVAANYQILSPAETVHGQWLVKQLPNGQVLYRGPDEAAARAAYETRPKETKNYVVFNDKIINIVKKYGLAGLVAGGASHFSTVPVDHQPDFGDQQQGMAAGGRIDGATSINRNYDVPYLAGSSNDDKTVYIDRRVPKRIAVKRANGKGYESIDPAEFLAEHEREEHKAMRAGKSYEKAHVENGTAAERAKVKAHGLDWDHYTKKMDGLLSHIEHEHPKKPPPDLYTKPYPHREATILKKLGHEGATRTERPDSVNASQS